MPRRSLRGYSPRRVNTREIRQTFLIVCEGEQTEPKYFTSFRVLSATVKIYGCGANTVSLVKRAIALSQEVEYDQIWCVFDRDSFPAQNFNQALILAKNYGIKIAYSNEAFEIWYLLHFNYLDAALSRSAYCDILSSYIQSKYTKNRVKINTPTGSGTGFIYMYNESNVFCGIATAAHVVDYTDEWHQPIRIEQPYSGKTLFLPSDERVIFLEWRKDSAVILVPCRDLVFPEKLIPLFPTQTPLAIGVEVGWLGFPAIASDTLCFFSGNISARRDTRNAYLIDGVAINGVSGGPVVYPTATDGVQIIGTVSAYRANRTGGDALPGLLIAQDVSHFHEIINQIRSMDEARRQRDEQEKLQQQEDPTQTSTTL